MNYYQILQIPTKAARTEVRAAYLRLVQESHPDRHVGEGDQQEAVRERFKQIQAAYEVLHDPDRRKLYDRSLLPSRILKPTASVVTPVRPNTRRDIPDGWVEQRRPAARRKRRKRGNFKRRVFMGILALSGVMLAAQCNRQTGVSSLAFFRQRTRQVLSTRTPEPATVSEASVESDLTQGSESPKLDLSNNVEQSSQNPPAPSETSDRSQKTDSLTTSSQTAKLATEPEANRAETERTDFSRYRSGNSQSKTARQQPADIFGGVVLRDMDETHFVPDMIGAVNFESLDLEDIRLPVGIEEDLKDESKEWKTADEILAGELANDLRYPKPADSELAVKPLPPDALGGAYSTQPDSRRKKWQRSTASQHARSALTESLSGLSISNFEHYRNTKSPFDKSKPDQTLDWQTHPSSPTARTSNSLLPMGQPLNQIQNPGFAPESSFSTVPPPPASISPMPQVVSPSEATDPFRSYREPYEPRQSGFDTSRFNNKSRFNRNEFSNPLFKLQDRDPSGGVF